MIIDSIYLDMDGTIADFHSSALLAHGLQPIPRDEWPLGVPLARLGPTELLQRTDLERSKFWYPINLDTKFWELLKPYPWLDELIELLVSKVGQEGLHICTSASREPASYSGKRRWLIRHGLAWMEPIIIQQKWRLSYPGALLIDDWEKHTDKFPSRGGAAILFPQPWNRNHHHKDDPVGFVRSQLEELSCISTTPTSTQRSSA